MKLEHSSHNNLRLAAATAVLAVLCGGVLTARSEVRRRPARAPVPEHVPPRPENTTACNYQEPQPFLVRANFVVRGRMSREERRARRQLHQKSIEYRTKQYGYFKGFGRPEWSPHPPRHYAKVTKFMGRRVRLNGRIIPALQCVEEQLLSECKGTPYQPRALSGIRFKNTYHTDEISNHVYGIAIDVDPSQNTCCGCVAQWADHPLCKRVVASIYERMAMPECWVHTFERFGFHWLGRDTLQDTMHFEFLGDPDNILRTPPDDGGGSKAESHEIAGQPRFREKTKQTDRAGERM